MESAKILLSPVVTEKSTNAQALQKYVFMVHLSADKMQVARAIEDAYGVKVKSVNIMPVLKKTRIAGRGMIITKRKTGRKAIVTLEPKQSIDFNKIKIS
jgi:large subunit ribosomal protein L23